MAETKRKSRKKTNSNSASGKNKTVTKSNKFGFLKDERTPKILGLFMLFVSILLTLSFISYLGSMSSDFSEVHNKPFDYLFNYEGTKEASNLAGRLGAVIAHHVFYYGFGLASFLFLPLAFVLSIKLLFKSSAIPLGKIFRHSFVFLIWISLVLGFALQSADFPYGGAFGKYLTNSLTAIIGSVGLVMIVLFSAITYIIVVFNPSFSFHNRIMDRVKESKKAFRFTDDDSEVKEWQEKIKEENKAAEPELSREKDYSEAANNNSEDKNTASESIEFEVPKSEAKKKNKDEPNLDLEINTPQDGEDTEAQSYDEQQDLEIEAAREEKFMAENAPEFDPRLDLSDYKFPGLDLLNKYGDNEIELDKEELEKNKEQILETLSNYNISISSIKATVGPTVTLYEIVPAAGVRISKIKNLEDDIALSLAALGIRIIAPIPGKGTIGIEVPNVKKEIVSMHDLIASEKFQKSKFELPIVLGKTISNEIFIADLAKMPHMLMAGATGQGKSVGLNAILVSLLYRKHPAELKFVLIDPKKVELTLFKNIEKHYLAKLPGEEESIITDTKKVIATLNALCIEMDNRYDLLKEAQVRNIKEYNAKFKARRLNPEKGHQFLPYFVLVIDEFADLMMTAGKEVETPIARLAQLARAIGIHLVIATQRPSVNIITGVIKANFPARIAFKVSSKVDSRTILDTGGADQLIGRGDMLLSDSGNMVRLQCGFVDTPEVEDITNFIGEQRGYPEVHQLPEYDGEDNEGVVGGLAPEDRDPLFEEAAQVIVQNQQGSTSLIQRRMKLGYNRAGRIMDQLEAAGIVGPNEGSKAREVLIPDMYQLEQFLSSNA
ncbi:MAG: DNA translocase FtsK [Chitinophagales bacterium]